MYDTNRIARAAEPCAYHEAFAEDMRRCNNKSLIFIYHKPRKYEEKESLL